MEAKEQPKILLVGTERNCRSIGYVLDFKNYEYVEKLTLEKFFKYQGYQIYVCDLKYKSKKLIDNKLLNEDLHLQYLDDICRMIDEDYVQKHYQQEIQPVNQTESAPEPVKAKTGQTMALTTRLTLEKQQHVSLMKRIVRGMKHPLKAAWHVVLRLKWHIKHWIKHFHWDTIDAIKHYQYNGEIYAEYRNYVCNLSTSDLLLFVLNAPINNKIKCSTLSSNSEAQIFYNGDVRGCCHCMVPLGNLLDDKDTNESFNGYRARIVRMSTMNRSFCLCPLDRCSCGYYLDKQSSAKTQFNKIWETPEIPLSINLSFVQSCNLACKSCRKERYVMNDTDKEIATTITKKLLDSGCLDQTNELVLAGMGEVFYSPYYRQILTTDVKRKQISIYSNGLLFNETNWQLVANKYESINVKISVDAATAETYQKIRGGDFNILMKNLKMIGELRQQGKIKSFKLCFVVQRDNFREMPLFVKIGHEIHVDKIYFQRLHNWGHWTNEEYLKKCLIVDCKYLEYDLWRVLQDPIFKSPIADLSDFYLLNKTSNKVYSKRYEQK